MATQKNYLEHWDQKFSTRKWGRYPPEDLVRFVGQNFRDKNPQEISVLEIGCGPGANLWFLHREGYRVFGIDSSNSAIQIALKRLNEENKGLNATEPELKAGDFSNLPWMENQFDLVVDIFSLYANSISAITKTIDEVLRVLKPKGKFYSKLWGTRTSGFATGVEMEKGTFENLREGPCENMGRTHFFEEAEIKSLFQKFVNTNIDTILRTDHKRNHFIEEFHCSFTKPE